MNEQETEKPTMPFLKALILADALGPEFRVVFDGDDVRVPSHRHRYCDYFYFVSDDRKKVSIGAPDARARIYRPAKREVSLIEALHWAAQDESREFCSGRVAYRFRGGEPQQKHCIDKGDWSRNITLNWYAPCTIDEGWEDVTAQVRVVVE